MSQMMSAGSVLAGSKGLWAAVGVLGLAVVGLGGALYSTVASKPPVDVAVVSAPPVVASPLPALEEPAEPAPPARARPAPAKKAQPAVTPPAAAPVCADCATVVSVTPFEREGSASGAGAVAGGVLGAIVGNQVGNGSGRDVARVIGAIGGGLAGHQVEKNMKKVQAYRVALRMDDNSRRTLEVEASPAVGDRVRVDGNRLQPLAR